MMLMFLLFRYSLLIMLIGSGCSCVLSMCVVCVLISVLIGRYVVLLSFVRLLLGWNIYSVGVMIVLVGL